MESNTSVNINNSENYNNGIQEVLGEAKNILDKIRNSGDQELYEQFKKEYEELENNIKEAKQDNNKISKEERLSIMLELGDIVNLSDEHSLIESRSWYSLESNKNEKTYKEAIDLMDKSFEEYTREELFLVLKYTNKNYKNYESNIIGGYAEEVLENISSTDSINDIENSSEMNIFQDKLIAKVLGGEEFGFGNGYIKGFNDKKGNYITKIEDFEKKLDDSNFHINGPKNAETTLNSREIANYLMYLRSTGLLNQKGLIDKLGIEKSKELFKLWKNNKDTIAQNILNESGLGTIIDEVNNINLFLKTGLEDIEQILILLPQPNSINLGFSVTKDLEDFKESIITCPNLGDNKDKFEQIISKIDLEIIKRKGEENMKIQIKKMIEKRLIKKGEIPEKIKNKIDTFSTNLFDRGIKNISENACAFDLMIFVEDELNKFISDKEIKPFLKKDTKIDNEELQNTSSIVSKANLEKSIKISEHIENDPDSTPEQKENAKKAVKKAERIHYFTQNTTSAEIEKYQELLASGTSKEEAVKQIVEESETLSKYFDTQENKENNIFSNKDENIKTENYSYDSESGTINISGESGNNSTIMLSEIEKEVVKNHPEAAENIVNYYSFFKELNLLSVWKYRNEIQIAMNDVFVKSNDEDYINKSELLKISSFILKIIHGKYYKAPINLSQARMELERYSGSLQNDERSFGKTENRDRLENDLFNAGVLDDIWGIEYEKLNKLIENGGLDNMKKD